MFVLWVVVRSIVGSLARYVMTKGGYRPIGDISPRVLGSLVGSVLFLGGWPAPPSDRSEHLRYIVRFSPLFPVTRDENNPAKHTSQQG